MKRRSGRYLVVAIGVLGAGLTSAAGRPQDGGQPPNPAGQDDARDLLRGPEVDVERVPGVDESLTMEPNRYMRAAGEPPVPHRQFMRALRSLAEGGDALALTPDQAQRVRAIEERFQSSLDAYRRQHQRESRELRAVVGEDLERMRGPDRRAVFQSLDEARRAAVLRLQEINRGAPSPDPVHAEMWAVLSEAQRERIAAWLDERVGRRDRAQGDAPAQPPPALTVEELTARLEALPEAQRRFVLREVGPLLERAEASAAYAEAPGVEAIEAPEMGDPGDPERGMEE